MRGNQSAESGVTVASLIGNVTTRQQGGVPDESRTAAPEALANTPGAAAILAAGIGSLALGVFAFVGRCHPGHRSRIQLLESGRRAFRRDVAGGCGVASLLVPAGTDLGKAERQCATRQSCRICYGDRWPAVNLSTVHGLLAREVRPGGLRFLRAAPQWRQTRDKEERPWRSASR